MPKKTSKRKTPRVPLEALRRLGSHPVTTKKGEKGYLREKAKKQADEMIKEEAPETAVP